MKKSQVITYGDAFVDYIAKDTTNESYIIHLGGAASNIAVGLSRLDVPTQLITVTGENETGKFARRELLKEGVGLEYAQKIPEKQVSGVYVHLLPGGERSFHKYVDETPDIQVKKSQVDPEAFLSASIFHISSGTMFHPVALGTTHHSVKLAKSAGALLSLDVNIRRQRWENDEQCRNTIRSFFPEVDILKLTEEELLFLTKASYMEEGIAGLEQFDIPLILVTVGESGTYALQNQIIHHFSVEKVATVDTTGAGDAFMAGILRYVHIKGIPSTAATLSDCVGFANRLGALATTKQGAMTAMPRLEEINSL